MSTGIVICSKCKREVHQVKPGKLGWIHCEDKTPICNEAGAIYPSNISEIVGKYCGKDDIKLW
jgi:hypothetical protein